MEFVDGKVENNIKGLLTYNCDIKKNAVLNWRFEEDDSMANWVEMAEGYLSCAKVLIKSIISDNKNHDADISIFPLLNIFNQGIENSLKALIRFKDENVDKSHNIEKLYEEFIELYKNDVYDIKIYFGTLKDYISDIKEFVVKDDYLMFTRYPEDTKENNFKYIKMKKDNYYIDLENFQEIIIDIAEKLSGMMSKMYSSCK